MGITVIPAYRVVMKFARQATQLPREEGIDLLEHNLREYVRNLLSMLNPSFMELGERSTVTQLGDPDPGDLVNALDELEAASPKKLVEEALEECYRVLPRPDLNTRVFLFPGDGESRVLVRQMKGVLGFSLGAQAMMVFLWPAEGWQRWLAYTVTHEYVHLVRNLLFPRALTGGKLVYTRSKEPETLLDAMVVEGLADAFATHVYPDMRPPWTEALDPEVQGQSACRAGDPSGQGKDPSSEGLGGHDLEQRLWPRVHRRFKVSDPTEIRRILFGDNDRIPVWTGYTVGFRIVQRYLEANPTAQPAGLLGLSAAAIFEASGYAQPS